MDSSLEPQNSESQKIPVKLSNKILAIKNTEISDHDSLLFWVASLRVLRTERISEIRCFQEVFAISNVNELMLKVA